MKVAERAEELASHSMRANHDLIIDLCRAKEAYESMSESSSDIIGVVHESGRVLRSNATFTRMTTGQQGQRNFIDLFSGELRSRVQNEMKKVSGGFSSEVSFEMPLHLHGAEKLIHWTIGKFDIGGMRRGVVLSVNGRDITELRNYERKLASIFTAIPLAVFSINKERKIEWPWSKFTEVVLGTNAIESASADELIFARSERFMSKADREGIAIFFNQLGAEEVWYDMSKDQFPREIAVGGQAAVDPERWYSLSYNPVIEAGVVEKVLVVMEDITDRVRARKELTDKRTKEIRIAETILDLQHSEPSLIASSADDIQAYLTEVRMLLRGGGSLRQICNLLHGVKGVARTINLRSFKELVHQTEQKLLIEAAAGSEPKISRAGEVELELVFAEWSQLRRFMEVYRAPSESMGGARSDSLVQVKYDILKVIDQTRINQNWGAETLDKLEQLVRSVGRINFIEVESRLLSFFEINKRKIGKNASIEFHCADCTVDRQNVPMICEIFYHLITNALDHGLESPEERTAINKTAEGKVQISASIDGERLRFEISDDGRGINQKKVLEKAARLGLISPSDILTEKETWALILQPQLTTAEQVTDVSGRGIGLDAVSSRIKKMGGQGLEIVRSAEGEGTTFRFAVEI